MARGTWRKDEIQRIARQKEAGELAGSGWGTFFERLQELVGMENLFLNMAYDDNPALQRVVDLVADFNYRLTCAVLSRVTPDTMGAGDDLGSQRAALVSPKTFRRWLKPGYARVMQASRAAGCEVAMHSDGYLLELVDDLIDAGLTILNPQVGPNTLAGLEETMKGRLCIALDLDRQHILPQGTPQDVRDHVREAVQVLGSPRGGLMLQAEINSDTPAAQYRGAGRGDAGVRDVLQKHRDAALTDNKEGPDRWLAPPLARDGTYPAPARGTGATGWAG